MVFPGTDGLVAWEGARVVISLGTWTTAGVLGRVGGAESPCGIQLGEDGLVLAQRLLPGRSSGVGSKLATLLPSIPGHSWLGSKSASCRLGWARRWVPGPHLTCRTPFPDSVSHHTSLLLRLCNLHPPFPVSSTFWVAEELVWRDPSSVRSEGAGQRGPGVGPSWGKWGFCWVSRSRPGTACGLGRPGGPRLPASLGLQEE